MLVELGMRKSIRALLVVLLCLLKEIVLDSDVFRLHWSGSASSQLVHARLRNQLLLVRVCSFATRIFIVVISVAIVERIPRKLPLVCIYLMTATDQGLLFTSFA